MTVTWIVVAIVFSALVVPRRARTTVGAAWAERWVIVVSMERVVVVVEGMEIVRRLGRRVKFRGYVCGEVIRICGARLKFTEK